MQPFAQKIIFYELYLLRGVFPHECFLIIDNDRKGINSTLDLHIVKSHSTFIQLLF